MTSTPTHFDIAQAMRVAEKAVRAGAQVAMSYFKSGVTVEHKADDTPVTRADRETEAAIVEVLTAAYPDFDILAEEGHNRSHPNARGRWIIDPIDGTKGFVRGGRYWGSILALEWDGEVVVGAVSLPASDDFLWAAKGQGCFVNGKRLQVSDTATWSRATLSVGELRYIMQSPHARVVTTLMTTAHNARCFGDIGGAVAVLTGHADVWVEAGVKIWDIAALKIMAEEAGGKFTDFSGNVDITRGEAVMSNGILHAHVLNVLQSQQII